MKLNRIIAVLVIAFLPTLVLAQNRIKVVEKSHRKAPEWLHSTGSEKFVTSASAQTIQEAKEKCLVDIKTQIVNAVAENIQSEISFNVTERTLEDGTMSYSDEFKQELSTSSAVVPFISGISMSKVEDFYYEKLLNKDTKQYHYSYSILYPFSKAELYMLISDFNAQDSKKSGVLYDLKEQYKSGVTSTTQIDDAILKLESLLEYFFDSVRIAETKALIEQYKSLYSRIMITMNSSRPGFMSYSLVLDGNVITSSVKPQVRSNCALGLSEAILGDGVVEVTYDSGGCLEDQENYIEIFYRFPQSPLRDRLYPAMTQEALRVATYSDMVVCCDSVSVDGDIYGLEVTFQLNNKTRGGVEFIGASVTIPEIQGAINFSGSKILLPQGVSSLTLSSDTSYHFTDASFSSLSFTRGVITLRSVEHGTTQTIPFIVKYILDNF